MHCLRWWLPIFLLPLPAASPFLTVLFVATYAIRTRPCAYCSVIILGLMFSTCALYSYDPSSSSSTKSEVDAHNASALPIEGGSLPSSCWIDFTSPFLTSETYDTETLNEQPDRSAVQQLGWWSAPTPRRSPTVLRAKAKMVDELARPAAIVNSKFTRAVRQWFGRLRSDGLWIGLGKDVGFRLIFVAD